MSDNHFPRDVFRADGKRAYVGYGVNRLTVGRVASLYPTAEEARITGAIVDAAATVRAQSFKSLAEGKGAPVTARFRPDRITLGDPNRAGEGAAGVLQRVYEKAI